MLKFTINGELKVLEKYRAYEYFTKLSKDSVVLVDGVNSELLSDFISEFLPCISGRCFGTLAGIEINTI